MFSNSRTPKPGDKPCVFTRTSAAVSGQARCCRSHSAVAASASRFPADKGLRVASTGPAEQTQTGGREDLWPSVRQQTVG